MPPTLSEIVEYGFFENGKHPQAEPPTYIKAIYAQREITDGELIYGEVVRAVKEGRVAYSGWYGRDREGRYLRLMLELEGKKRMLEVNLYVCYFPLRRLWNKLRNKEQRYEIYVLSAKLYSYKDGKEIIKAKNEVDEKESRAAQLVLTTTMFTLFYYTVVHPTEGQLNTISSPFIYWAGGFILSSLLLSSYFSIRAGREETKAHKLPIAENEKVVEFLRKKIK